jgi:hypothetical protein
MLEFSHTDNSLNVQRLIEQKNEAKSYLDREEKLIDTLAIARNKIQQFKTTAQSQSLVSLIKETKKEINTNHPSFYLHPKQVANYLDLIRGSLLYNRDIRELEPIAIELYNRTKEKGGFSVYTLEHQLRILYLLSHSLYRNQKLEDCLVYIEETEALLIKSGQARFHHYFAKTTALKSSIYFLTNQLTKSINVIEEFLNDSLKITKEDELNLKLNLLTYYAYDKQYKTANRFLIQMHHSDGWYRKLMGQEWLFKKNSIEMLLYFEMGKDDIALNRINSIIKANNDLTELSQYKGVVYYLKLFKNYIEDPTRVTESDLLTISNKSNVVSLDNEIKKTAFYSWFLAKVKNEDPYECLLHTIKNIDL